MLRSVKDETLSTYAEVIKAKSEKLNYNYEDIKTDSANIKNSLRWISTVYKRYLMGETIGDFNDYQLAMYITNLLSRATQGDIFIEIKPFSGNTDSMNVHKLGLHLDTVHAKYKNLALLKKELIKNDIFSDLNDVVNYTEATLKELHSETSNIIRALLVSSIFLVLYGVFIYVREAYAKLESEKLQNELKEFVHALDESSIVSKADISGKITYVNDMFCEVSGYSREELIGKRHNIVKHPEMDEKVFKEMWSTILSDKIFRAIIKNRKKNGDPYYVDTVIVPLHDHNDNLKEFLAVRYDVTELITSRDVAIKAEKAKGEFLSNMSHELRTPLNAIVGFSSLLSKQIENNAHLKYIQNIKASSEHLVGIINDILDLSKLDSGNFTLDYHDFNLHEKVEYFLEHFHAELEISKLKLKVDLDKSVYTTLHADWLRISQIITNLMSNAMKFSYEGGTIYFGLKYENSNLYIVVEDNGIGISKEAQDKIFNPFQQADTSTTRKYGGTGLGLSITLNLIKQMNGNINLTSREGEGSRFEVILPLEEASYIEENIINDDDMKELSGHILIAEDNKTNQMLIGLLVEDMGLTYTLAEDGEQAVEKFPKEKFDLILMDENMPKMNGLEAMSKIRKMKGGELPIISLTANVMQGDKEKFLSAGMDGYIPKPIDDKELYFELKKFLNEK